MKDNYLLYDVASWIVGGAEVRSVGIEAQRKWIKNWWSRMDGGALQCGRLRLRSDRLVCSGGGRGGDEIQVAVGRVMVMMVDNSLGRTGGSSNRQLMIVLWYHGG